jgi:5-methylcytosine-specific restriction enzyme A
MSGCPALVEAGRYCVDHAASNQSPREARPSASGRGYDAKWRSLRLMFLRRNPICIDPFHIHAGAVVPATDVDHIIAKRNGGRDTFENFQALCHSCHSRKTNQEL